MNCSIFQGGWSINTNLYGSHVDGAVLPALQWMLAPSQSSRGSGQGCGGLKPWVQVLVLIKSMIFGFSYVFFFFQNLKAGLNTLSPRKKGPAALTDA